MELKKIQIRNFRSIKDLTIKFDHNCLILLGKNEAGKSNILKAIAAVFNKYKVAEKDKRKRIENEKIEEFFVRAVIGVSHDDFLEVKKRFEKKYKNTEGIKFKSGKSFDDFIKTTFNEFLIRIDIGVNKIPQYTYWKPSNNEFEIAAPLYLVEETRIVTEPAGAVEFDVLNAVLLILVEIYSEKPYKCHYWQYNDTHLLPNKVAIAEFIANPEKVKGLYNIFILCGRENIKKEFNDALLQDGDYSNLFEQVSVSITNTFQKIWKDFKATSIQLTPNGSEMLIKVVNKAKYAFEDRSDGFKKFISILLMLSTQSRANKILEKDIILIDEPDQSLYPTSAQYLRDELLDMSKKSKIIYSTHSQYMIDSNCLDRHLIIEKTDDITCLRKEDINSPFSNDELLRRAIGVSIFDCLQPKNIIFEGWLDKELFDKYIKFNKLHKEYKDYGKVYLGGISGVETLVQILALANKKFIIVSDSDNTSKNKKMDFIKKYPEYADNWLSYSEVLASAETMEDFIVDSYIEEKILKYIETSYKFNKNISAIGNIAKASNNDQEKKQLIKNKIIGSITKDKVRPEYSHFIEKLKGRIDML